MFRGSTTGVNSNKNMATRLQETSLQVLSNTKCRQSMPLYTFDRMYCALDQRRANFKSNLCYGDSGNTE